MDPDIFDGSSSLSEREYEREYEPDIVVSSNGNGNRNRSRFAPREEVTISEDDTTSSTSTPMVFNMVYDNPISAGNSSVSGSRRAPRVNAGKGKRTDDDLYMVWDDDKVG